MFPIEIPSSLRQDQRMTSNHPTLVCLDFDGTIMRYDQPPDHFHPEVIDALNRLQQAGIPWISNSGRDYPSQLDIIGHSRDEYGLAAMPLAILHSECFIHINAESNYTPLEHWNNSMKRDLESLQEHIASAVKEDIEALVRGQSSAESVYYDQAAVFIHRGPEDERQTFIAGLNSLLEPIAGAHVIQNGEFISVIHERAGKGNLLRAYLEYSEISPSDVLAIGDHDNDITMLDGSVTPHVACPGNSFPPVREVVRQAGGYLAEAHGPAGTVEALQFYFPDILKTEFQSV